MKKTLNSLLAAMLLAAGASAFAASSTELTVTGFITPAACEPSLSNGGKVHYGKISTQDLREDHADKHSKIGVHTLQLTITCNASTQMGLEAKDNREGSNSTNNRFDFGLGLINETEKLGTFTLAIKNAAEDGNALDVIKSENGQDWYRGSGLDRIYNFASVASTGTLDPLPVKSVTADLVVTTWIAPTRGLTLTSEVPLDGSVTLTVRYL
jgi:type 1 fimbria pilin